MSVNRRRVVATACCRENWILAQYARIRSYAGPGDSSSAKPNERAGRYELRGGSIMSGTSANAMRH